MSLTTSYLSSIQSFQFGLSIAMGAAIEARDLEVTKLFEPSAQWVGNTNLLLGRTATPLLNTGDPVTVRVVRDDEGTPIDYKIFGFDSSGNAIDLSPVGTNEFDVSMGTGNIVRISSGAVVGVIQLNPLEGAPLFQAKSNIDEINNSINTLLNLIRNTHQRNRTFSAVIR